MKIITLEGLDKAGKATQAKLLTEWLSSLGFNTVQSSFHRYDTPTGQLIQKWLFREYDVDQTTIELIITADKQAQQKWFSQLEKEGVDFLILDRYTTSQLVYSKSSGLDIEWVKELQKHMRKPDLELFINIPPEVSLNRKGKFGENDRYESDLEFLKEVNINYWDLIIRAGNPYMAFNGELPVEELHKFIRVGVNYFFQVIK